MPKADMKTLRHLTPTAVLAVLTTVPTAALLAALLFLMPLTVPTATVQAQNLTPVTRFHAGQNPNAPYFDELLSGFLQSASPNIPGGFLQMPFVGNPVWVYVGEKDSTQFMAYASGYEFAEGLPPGKCRARLTRYDIRAELTEHPAFLEQLYTYPDTTAEKGFLIDLDHALSGPGCEDMDVVFIDKRTIRAHRRTAVAGNAAQPDLYYYARFSHPFTTWNVRRERVTLENGQKESRCKVAFTFPLKPGEQLKVISAVSALSTNEAYACVEGHRPATPFSDKRKPLPPRDYTPLLAQNEGGSPSGPASRRHGGTSASRSKTGGRTQAGKTAPASPYAFIEITTRQAPLQAAFHAAMNRLISLPAMKGVTQADDFLQRLAALYPAAEPAPDALATDSLLRSMAQSMLKGENEQADATAQAAWYVFNAIGFRPVRQSAGTWQVVRPVFNIVTLHVGRGRRFILHTKRNLPSRPLVGRATLQGNPLPVGLTFTHEQLVRGGIMEITCSEANL